MKLVVIMCIFAQGCATPDQRHEIKISIADQRMVVTDRGTPVSDYSISTSKFGLGSKEGSCATPLGRHQVVAKIGKGLPEGGVLKSRRFTGEILSPGDKGRDPIVTRILWLDGLSPENQNSFERYIYIHGTPAEGSIGRPASYGCVRMRSSDIVELYSRVGVGATVDIFPEEMISRIKHVAPRPNSTPD